MKRKRNIGILPISCIFLLLFSLSSFQERYCCPSKVYVSDNDHQLKTIQVIVNNQSPEYLSNMFKNNIKLFCLKQLGKYGYVETQKDTAEYKMTIELKIDSFRTLTRYRLLNRYHLHENLDMQLSISYLLINSTRKLKIWENKDELYFFEDEPKDFARSKSMIRYSFKQIPEQN